MAAPVFSQNDGSSPATLVADLKEMILKSSDWAHLQLSTGTQNTTLASGASPGATSISTNATIPSGSTIIIGNGSANPEVRVTTGVSGAGPYTVTFAKPLVGTYATSAAVGVGTYVKATTTRGAQMVIDLGDQLPSALSNNAMGYAFYRTHDGTTAADKLVRYIRFKNAAGTTTMTLHLEVSVCKESIWFSVEGPRGGETSADDANNGSVKQCAAMADIVPYFGSTPDPTAAVCAIGHVTNAFSDFTPYAHVSRNMGNTASWVICRLATLASPGGVVAGPPLQLNAKGDGNLYLLPYVVFEATDGIRGRLAKLYFLGVTGNVSYSLQGNESFPNIGETVTYNDGTANTYRVVTCARMYTANSNPSMNALGYHQPGAVQFAGPAIAVPTG